jgi:hypothetical protein
VILTADDFQLTPYIIPNQEDDADLQAYIDKREAHYLKEILGNVLYKEFKEGLEASPPIEQRWLDLKYGTNSGIDPVTDGLYDDGKYEWLGIVDLLVPAIWQDWVRDNYNTYTNSGMVRATAQNNSEAVNPDHDMVKAWNEFVNKLSGYPRTRRNTLYGFIKDRADYGEWTFTCRYRYKNVLDI